MTDFVTLEAPRIEKGRAMLIAGLSERYTYMETAGIPAQWQRFSPHIGHVPDQRGPIGYGVCYDFGEDGQFSYLCGVEVSRTDHLPDDLTLVPVAEADYAVFTHRGRVSTIAKTMRSIWQKWLPSSGYRFAETPGFERYDDRFDSQTGSGVVDIWVPIKS